MRTITEVTKELEAARSLVQGLRQERESILVEKSGLKAGVEITRGKQSYRVRGVSASSLESAVWVDCHWKTTAGKWSQGSKVIHIKVEES